MKYIPKLHIHQHSLLTRKLFSRHIFSAQVFFSVSSGSSSSPHHLQVIFIIRSGSSLDLDHHWTSSLDLDHHHWIWIIITGSRSSLDLDHIWSIISGSGSSLDIITGSGSSLDIITGFGSSLLDHHHWIITGAISLFFSSLEVLQSHPFFILVVGLAFM